MGPSPHCGFSEVALGNGADGFSKVVGAPGADITTGLIYRDLNLDGRQDVAFTDALSGDMSVGLATTGTENCAPPASSSIAAKICAPVGTTSSTTFTVKASGNSPSGIKRLEVWIDGVKKYQKWSDQVAKSFTLSAGQHRIAVVAVDKYKGTAESVALVEVK